MQAKQYQQRVLDALDTYLNSLDETGDIATAFDMARDASDGGLTTPYRSSIPRVPQLTYKVPTGGGKTFLAAASLDRIMASLPVGSPQVVVWLVPRDAILTQTLDALRNENHPYRQRLNRDFQGRVAVYSKDELLAGQNFTYGAVVNQLSIMVLSYDSFRRSGEGLRAYEDNGALMSFASALGQSEAPISNARPTSLFQVINSLNPVVILDESHRATSPLSLAMLQNFNPSFVLSLTATPSESANILTQVRATELKAEQMVKLPVLVVNRSSQTEVIADVIDLRAALEEKASQAQAGGSAYCRPIALVQAEPRGPEDALTFEALRGKLGEAGVPREHIAIKTATVDELRDVDLLSPECQIRFIITVNALVEGWDCPFAYILAALANRNSAVNVEQVVGRILRQPYARRFPDQTLNMSYVLTSSNQFERVVTKVVAGLNEAGFTRADVRVGDVIDGPSVEVGVSSDLEPESNEPAADPDADEGDAEGVLDFDVEEVAEQIDRTGSGDRESTSRSERGRLVGILDDANQAADEYEAQVQGEETGQPSSAGPPADGGVGVAGYADQPDDTIQAGTTVHRPVVREFRYMMNSEFIDDARAGKLPQFVQGDDSSLLIDAKPLFEPASLSANLRLRGRDTILTLDGERDSFRTVDVNEQNVPVWELTNSNVHDLVNEHMRGLPDETRLRASARMLVSALDRHFDWLPSRELNTYVQRVVEDMGGDQRILLETQAQRVVKALRSKIRAIEIEHAKSQFQLRRASGQIVADPVYELPRGFNFQRAHESIAKSLYEGEDSMNQLEIRLVTWMSSMPNLRWWHRNPSRTGFRINGYINHYPDFIVRTVSGSIVLIETKSDHLNADSSMQRLDVGEAWANAAGDGFHYFMVFDDDNNPINNAHRITPFREILERL